MKAVSLDWLKFHARLFQDRFPERKANADFLDQSLERSHRRAFEDAYDMGRRRQGATFDEDKYIKDVLTLMIRDCNQANKRDLVDTLMQVREVLLAEE